MELLLSLKEEVPNGLWRQFQLSVQVKCSFISEIFSFDQVMVIKQGHILEVKLMRCSIFRIMKEFGFIVKHLPLFSGLYGVKVSFCCVQSAHSMLQKNGITQLSLLAALGHQSGVWTNCVLQDLLSNVQLQTQQGKCHSTVRVSVFAVCFCGQ